MGNVLARADEVLFSEVKSDSSDIVKGWYKCNSNENLAKIQVKTLTI